MPTRVRSRIMSRSNRANTPIIFIAARPNGLEVSNASVSDLSPAPESQRSTLTEVSLKGRLRELLGYEVARASSETTRNHDREAGRRFLAYTSIMMSSEAVPIGHHDEQGITLDGSSASTARQRNHSLYLIQRRVFTAAAGVVWLADWRLLLALC